MLDLSPGDLRWLLSDSTWDPDGHAQRAVMGSALVICCRTAMKKRICTWVTCRNRLERTDVRSASERTPNPMEM